MEANSITPDQTAPKGAILSGIKLLVMFDLILYVPVNNFSVMSGWAFLG